MKAELIIPIDSLKGKLDNAGYVYFRTNKKTGKVYTGKLCNPSTGRKATRVA